MASNPFLNSSSPELLSVALGASAPSLLREESLIDLFRHSVGKHPQKIALRFGSQALTYQELERWSNQIAVFLKGRGIQPGTRIGLWWPRGLELHAIVLGILKAGAAYIPFDQETPAERVAQVLEEAECAAYFGHQDLNLDRPCLAPPALPLPGEEIEAPPPPSPNLWAYVIYTSGSTGTPKGIPITHRQICHLVRAEQSVFGIQPQDRVYQGFSISFDMWCEETWISYLAGASLWVADAATAKDLDELERALLENEITVLHAVPSLLAVLNPELPSLRLINAGGEACTPQVLSKWARGRRRFFNTYGPTETTVSATIAELRSGQPITIGQALPNYGLAVVDEDLNPLPCGQRGELVIAGPGVSEGYIRRPELTRQKFVAKPASLSRLPGERIYRTGDAALMGKNGEIEFQGRMDDQIKLRGYRIELGEIESRLLELTGIRMAAVALKKDARGQDQLVAYVATEAQDFDASKARKILGEKLPSYMLPSAILRLEELPRLPSGKIDRKSLPNPPSSSEMPSGEISPDMPLEEKLCLLLRDLFPGQDIDLSKDFFNDLGGHSLLAASFVSTLRQAGGLPQASIKDVYLCRPLSALLEKWGQAAPPLREAKPFHRASAWRHVLCGCAQALALVLVYGLLAAQIFLPYLAYYYAVQESSSHAWGIATALISFCFIPPFYTLLSIASKWLLLGKTKPGSYPLWGSYYFRWWLVKTLQKLMPIDFLNGTPLYPLYLRLLGCKVSSSAQLSSFQIGAEDLVSIGHNVSISSNVVLNNAVVEEGWLKLQPLVLEDHAYVGTSSVVDGNCRIGRGGELGDLSLLRSGEAIRSGEIWKGSPARCTGHRKVEEFGKPPLASRTLLKYAGAYLLLLLIFPFTVLLPLLPSIIALNEMDNAASAYDFKYLALSPLLAASYIGLFIAETVLLTRWLMKGVQEGSHPVYSKLYLRKWLNDQIMALSLFVLHPIYATVYASPLFRALGARVGKNAEISTASQVTHGLLEIGEGAFIADAVALGESDVRSQLFTLRKTSIGNQSFVGNSALIPQGYALPDGMLIGVLSTPPEAGDLAREKARDWFGSPAIALPKRQESANFPPQLTLHPRPARKIARAAVELARILLPSTAVMCFSTLFIAFAHDLLIYEDWGKTLLYFPFYYLFFVGFPSLLLTALLKWAFAGRYKACQAPMWTWKVWKTEAITTTYEALAVPFFLEYLKGTPWLSLTLRLFGVRIGKRVWMNTTDITEFDMVEIGDEAALNNDCGPQTHLFEDRVMKVGPVSIGKRSHVGTRSVILYDSVLGDDTRVEALSLVMKGEDLPARSHWVGSPVHSA